MKHGALLPMAAIGAALIAANFLLTASPACAATFTVNSTGDAEDNKPGNGTCATQPFLVRTEAECTSRAAVEETNATAAADTISFNIGGEQEGPLGGFLARR